MEKPLLHILLSLIVMVPVAVIALSAPIGATLCGWIALGRIRRSNGRLRGQGLAWFAALCYPGLLLLALLGAVAVMLFRFTFAPRISAVSGWGAPVVVPSHPNWLDVIGLNSLLLVVVAVAVGLIIAISVWAVRRKPDRTAVNATKSGSGKGCLIALLVCCVLALPLIFVVLAIFWTMSASAVPHRGSPTLGEVRTSVESGPTIHRIEYHCTPTDPATLNENVARPMARRLQGLPNVKSVTTHSTRDWVVVYVTPRNGLSPDQIPAHEQRIYDALNQVGAGDLPLDVSWRRRSLCSSVPEVIVEQVDVIAIVVDRDKASALGVSLESINLAIRETRGDRPDSPAVLRDLQQATLGPPEHTVLLSSMATITLGKGPSVIIRTYPAQPNAEAGP